MEVGHRSTCDQFAIEPLAVTQVICYTFRHGCKLRVTYVIQRSGVTTLQQERHDSDLATVARLYYVDGRSQKEIATVMSTTRSNVSRMLTAARDRGLVQIRILEDRDEDLERRIAQRFPTLTETIVARYEPTVRSAGRVGDLCARWLLDHLRDSQKLAVSWGRTLQDVVSAVLPDRAYDVEVVQLVGGLSPVSSAPSGQELVRDLAGRLGARHQFLQAPAVFDRPESAASLKNERSIAAALVAARKADIALVGVGAVDHGSSQEIVQQMRLSRTERREFDRAHLAGDICGRYFDALGQPFEGAANDRVLGLTLRDLRKIPSVVGVATGSEKGPAVAAALRGGLLDVVCCDAQTAHSILRLTEEL